MNFPSPKYRDQAASFLIIIITIQTALKGGIVLENVKERLDLFCCDIKL